MDKLLNNIKIFLFNLKIRLFRNKFIKILNSFFIKSWKVFPLYINHHVTYNCNADCDFCYLKDKTREKFNYKGFEQFLSQIGYLKTVIISGGEPFLFGNLKKIIRAYIRENNCKEFVILTNGSFPHKTYNLGSYINNLKGNIRTTFIISIDNFEKEHNKYRGISNLSDKISKTVELINSLDSEKIKIKCNVVINDNNYDNI